MKTKTLIPIGFGLLALALVGLVPAHGQDAVPFGDLGGKLEGRVLYTHGHEAKVVVELEPTADGFAGTYTLTLITEDAPEVRTGKVQATVEGDVVRARFDDLRAKGKLAKAGSHAKFAIYGTFADPGGVFMLYRYGR